MNPVRDAYATAPCGFCQEPVAGRADKQWCSTQCRQKAWRRAAAAPVAPAMVAKPDTVYACDGCGARYVGDQRCDDCNRWCRKVGPGGCCPNCDAPVAITDIIDADQLAATASPGRRGRP